MPVYTIELTDGRRIKLEAADEQQAMDTAELYERGGEKAVEARYGDMSYPAAAATRGVAGATASLSAPFAAAMDYATDRIFGAENPRTYDEYLTASRAKLDNARDRAGVGYEIAGGVAGAAIPGLGGASNLVRGGTGFANMAARTGLGAAEGAAYGGIQAASEGDNVLDSALMGGALGGAGSLVAQGARKVLSPAQQTLASNPRIARQVGVLNDAKVRVPASTQNQSKPLASLEQQASRTILAGGRDVAEQSYDDFTKAVASKLDDSARTADEIGPQFWDKVSNQFDEGYANLRRRGSVVVPGPVSRELDAIIDDIGWYNLTDAQYNKIRAEITNLKGTGVLSGRAYQETHQRLSKLIREQQGGSEMRGVLIRIQSALADGFRASDPALKAQADQMRRQYRLYKQIEPAVDPRTGRIDPHKLYRSVKRSEGDRRFLRGEGELTALSEAGSSLIRQPGTSNTFENMMNAGVLSGSGAAIGSSILTGNPLPATMLGLGLGGRAAADAYLTSPLGQRHLKADWLSGAGARMGADVAGQMGARSVLNTLTPEQRKLMGGR